MNDLDEHYRRVSALDASAPGEATRLAVLAHAAGLIAAPRARRRRRALWGSLAAAGLAGFLVVPQWWTHGRQGSAAPSPAQDAARPEAEGRLRATERAAAAAADNSANADALAKRDAQAGPRAAGAGDALGDAAERGDLVALQALLDERVDVDARDSAGRSAVLRASLRGQRSAVALLLSRGADPNLADRNGVTPLQAARSAGHAAVAAALRRAGARQAE